MSKQERILTAIENIINEFGKLRAEGIVADMWHKPVHDLRTAAWNAYHEQKKVVEKQTKTLTSC